MSNLFSKLLNELAANRNELNVLVSMQIKSKQLKKNAISNRDSADFQSEISRRRIKIKQSSDIINSIRAILSDIPRGEDNLKKAIHDSSLNLDNAKRDYVELTQKQRKIKKMINTDDFDTNELLAEAQSQKHFNKLEIKEISSLKVKAKAFYKLVSDSLYLIQST